MSDILERLRKRGMAHSIGLMVTGDQICNEAADEIARLQQRVEELEDSAKFDEGVFMAEHKLRRKAEARERVLREVLEDIAVYGCGMLNQPYAMNGPGEEWLNKQIREYERRARAALSAHKEGG
jgi:glutamate synthase domain-containing protein 1